MATGTYPVRLPVPHDESEHTPYSRVDGSKPFTGEVAGVTPTQDASLATKKYIDDAIPENVSDPMIDSMLLMGA